MNLDPTVFLEDETLVEGLEAVLYGDRPPGRNRVTVLRREPNQYAGSLPSEVVTCRLEDRGEVRLLCKYASKRDHIDHDHRGGIDYEASVYQHVLQPRLTFAPTFYGLYDDARTGRTWLVFEYVDGSSRAAELQPYPMGMVRCAAWIGEFHARLAVELATEFPPPLKRFDAEYYLDWQRRAQRFAGAEGRRLPWFDAACERYPDIVDRLLAQVPTVIHGDYYPDNVLVRDDTLYVVDWEFAAIAVGEIDLASLTDRWPSDVVRDCERAYCQARWAGVSPANFAPTLEAARLYLHFRLLGEAPGWPHPRGRAWRYDLFRETAERLELL